MTTVADKLYNAVKTRSIFAFVVAGGLYWLKMAMTFPKFGFFFFASFSAAEWASFPGFHWPG